MNQAAQEVARLIRLFGESAAHTRPVRVNDGFYGSHESSETSMGSLPIEVQMLDPKDIQETGANARAHVLPDAAVAEGDFLAVQGTRYRVTNIKKHNLFGVVTHQELLLEKERLHG